MKKILFTLILITAVFGCAMAQIYMTDVMKPTSEKRYTPMTTKSSPFCIAIYGYKGGFKLSTGLGGLISSDNPGGHATFNLGGAYDKISFVMGPYGGEFWGDGHQLNGPNSNGDKSNVIVTVTGDDETLLDEVVWTHDAPREVVLDVKGVKELRFDVLRGETEMAFAQVRLWKAGQKPAPVADPLSKLPAGKVELVKNLWPYYYRHSGYIAPITDRTDDIGSPKTKSISINRVTYTSGLELSATQQLLGECNAWGYFWLQKKYDKVSFIVGPRDNQSSNASGWLTVKADGKIIYEHRVTQKDLAEQVILDVKGVNQLSFHSVDEHSDFLGGLTFGVVNIYAYRPGDNSVPASGVVNASLERISQLPDVCKMCSKIKPYSVRGVSSNSNTYFDGATKHYTFSMGGEKFWEGFILTTGNTLFDDNIDSYAAFDLAGEYDWISFTAGTLTNHRVLDDDLIRVYADDKLVLETKIYATWPNQHFEIPIHKCRTLRFAKPGTGKKKQTYIGIADVVLYRGKPVENKLFVHEKPDCPETVDLIDLTHGPYFHYVGRYLSSLTNFSINDCYKDGSSQREFFPMKDGSKIYKGTMLETNIPLSFEDISLSEALFMFVVGAGSSISSSNVAAYTGVSAGAGLGGGLATLSLFEDGGRQSSVAAFNPFGEYESCTFTVANKSEYIDSFDEIIGGQKQAPPVKLMVFADQRKVGEFMLIDKMPPTTYTVAINKCTQLMFWLQCGDVRSGQYVLYDMTLDKKKLPPTPSAVTNSSPQPIKNVAPSTKNEPDSKKGNNRKDKGSKPKKEKPLVNWVEPSMSGNSSMDTYLKAVNEVWRANQEMQSQAGTSYQIKETYVEASDGTAYKAVTFFDAKGNKQSIAGIMAGNNEFANMEKVVRSKAADADLYVTSASLAVPNMGDKMFEYGKYIRLGSSAVSQCRQQASDLVSIKQMENDVIANMQGRAVVVDGVQSTDKTILLPLSEGETVPEGTVMQQVRYFLMD